MTIESVNALAGIWARQRGDRWLITDGPLRRTLSGRTWPLVRRQRLRTRELGGQHG